MHLMIASITTVFFLFPGMPGSLTTALKRLKYNFFLSLFFFSAKVVCHDKEPAKNGNSCRTRSELTLCPRILCGGGAINLALCTATKLESSLGCVSVRLKIFFYESRHKF